MVVKVIGLNTAKHVFQLHGADSSGRRSSQKAFQEKSGNRLFASLAQCVVGLEATRGSHYWSRVIGSFGHQVRLIAPQFVKPYLKGQNNDPGDAAAICEAVTDGRFDCAGLLVITGVIAFAIWSLRYYLVGSG